MKITLDSPHSKQILSGFLPLIGFLSLLLFSGCATDSASQQEMAGDADKKAGEHFYKSSDKKPTDGEIDFFDSESFDWRLSSVLRHDFPEATVKFMAPFTVNEVPKRLDKWFSAVREHGGTVDIKQDPKFKQRGLIGVAFSLLATAYDLAKEYFMYSQVKGYDAIMYYQKGTGVVTRLVFEKRQPTEEAK